MDNQLAVATTHYSNGITLNMSPYDLVLNFGLNLPTNNAEEQQTTPLCTVILSPHHAKALAQMLTDAVGKYESEHGVMQIGAHGLTEPVSPAKEGHC
jgi:hypothetical protein